MVLYYQDLDPVWHYGQFKSNNITCMTIIWRAWITLCNGRRIYASDYGKSAFRLEVDDENRHQKKEPAVVTADPSTD